MLQTNFLGASHMTCLAHHRPSPQLEGTSGHPIQGHSPLKVRHSVDLGVDRSKLLGDEGPTVAQEVGVGAQRQDPRAVEFLHYCPLFPYYSKSPLIRMAGESEYIIWICETLRLLDSTPRFCSCHPVMSLGCFLVFLLKMSWVFFPRLGLLVESP